MVVRIERCRVQQIQLTNTAFEGRNSIYLLGADGEGPTTLVDTGVATAAVRKELERSLATYDVTFADIDRVLLTHWHSDHAGLAGAIQSAGNASVYVHENDAPLVRGDRSALDAIAKRQREYFDEWGMPEEERDGLLDFLDGHEALRGSPVTTTTINEGDTIRAGPCTVSVVHLPGHASGLVAYVFEDSGRREAFVGDAILPKYTPNVGGADVRVDAPLRHYLDSLERIVELSLDRAWPGHRGAIFAPSERARDIAAHHVRRTRRVYDVVAERGPVTAWEVSAALFGHLENIHVLHGPGEAYAHLDHLVDAGLLAVEAGSYEVIEETQSPEAVVTRERLTRQ